MDIGENRRMKYDPERHHRRSIRLKGYDYSLAGAYFVTLCANDKASLFGEVIDGDVKLNDAGQLVSDVWNDLPRHYLYIELDAFVIMPNHFHGILVIVEAVGAELNAALSKHGLSEIIRGFKTFSARRINELRRTPGVAVWQRNYYEHIIRDEKSLHGIRKYIANNPMQWELDRENPNVVRTVLKPVPKEEEPWRI